MRQAGLTAIRMVPGDPVLWLKLAKDARWLSHHAAVEALCRSFVSILTRLDRKASERSEPTASGLLNFIALSFFADILPHLSELSRTLQSSSFPNVDIHSFSLSIFNPTQPPPPPPQSEAELLHYDDCSLGSSFHWSSSYQQ